MIFDDAVDLFINSVAHPATLAPVVIRTGNRGVAHRFSLFVPKNSAFPGMKKADRRESRSIIPSRMTLRRREVRETPFERE